MPWSLLFGNLRLAGEERRDCALTAALGLRWRCRLLAFFPHALAGFLDLRLIFRVDRGRRRIVAALESLAAVPIALGLLARCRAVLPGLRCPGTLLLTIVVVGPRRTPVTLRTIAALLPALASGLLLALPALLVPRLGRPR